MNLIKPLFFFLLLYSCNNNIKENSNALQRGDSSSNNVVESKEISKSSTICYAANDESGANICCRDSLNFIIFTIELNDKSQKRIFNGVAKYMGDFQMHKKASNAFYENPEDNQNPFPVDQFECEDKSYIYDIGIGWKDPSKLMFTIYASNDPKNIVFKTTTILYRIK